MANDPKDPKQNDESSSGFPRRDFITSVAAGLAVAGSASGAMSVVETEVEIKTPDGTSNAVFIHPAKGSHPGVLLWTDAFGLRPSMRAMGKRLSAQGYSVLVPNPFYRMGKGVFFEDASTVNFARDRGKIQPLMESVGADGHAEMDAIAYIGFLDAQKQVNTSKKIGTQGYCMGGPLVMRTCATVPDRVGAGGSFHGGGLVTDKPNSPHLLAPKIKAKMYFGVAHSDDARQPDAKVKLKEAFIAAGNPATIEVYETCTHGWCVPDMPPSADGKPIYDKPEAEKAWAKLLALYKANIA
ncbi:MAG TPA: dienelactone hydrolase family protein [Bryobacteraceae bacterium]|nr:dienelactone hydrolase family protein [Bryobacteraceae bacterium]